MTDHRPARPLLPAPALHRWRAWRSGLAAAVLLACGASAPAALAADPPTTATPEPATGTAPPTGGGPSIPGPDPTHVSGAAPSGATPPPGPAELPELLAGERGWFGVQLEPVEMPEAQTLGFDHALVRVGQVFPGTPAETAGVLAGDLVLSFEGRPVPSTEQLVEWVSGTAPGTQVTFVLQRGAQQLDQPVLLGVRPELDEMVVSMFRDHPAPPVAANLLADDTPFVLPTAAGHVVVLDFWATWCGPCRHAMPELAAMQTRFADRGVTFVGISNETPDVLRTFAAENPVGYTLAYDLGEQTTDNYFITAYPTLFVIDQTGTVRDVFIGGAELPALEARIAELTGSAAPAP